MPRSGKHLAGDWGASSTAANDDLAALARAAAGGGDPDAAATLVAHVGGPMLKVVRKVLGRRHPDVDDVAQDAVIAFLGALASFRGEATVVRFGQRVALLTAMAASRRNRLRGQRSEALDEDVAARAAGERAASGEGASPLATAVASRRRTLVRRLLDDLPESIAEALALHFVVGHTVDEIAAEAGISPNTVWSRLRLGKRALRRKLQGDARLAEMLRGGHE